MEQMLICLSLALIAGLLMSRAAKAVRLPAGTAYLLTGLLLDGSAEAHAKKAELWQYLKDHVTPGVYRAVRVNLGGLTDLHFPGGDKVVVATYRQLRKIFKFN